MPTCIQNTNSQYNLPDIGKKVACKANREGIADRFQDPDVRKSIQTDLALIDTYDRLLTDLELHIVNTAKPHDVNTFYRLRSVPGIGKILSLVMLYEIHDIARFPRVQEFVSYCRLVTCARKSAGKHSDTSGSKIGNAYLKWALSEAAVLFLRNNEAGQKYLAREDSCCFPHRTLRLAIPAPATDGELPTNGEECASRTPHWTIKGKAGDTCSTSLPDTNWRVHPTGGIQPSF